MAVPWIKTTKSKRTTYHYCLWKTLYWSNHYSATGNVPVWNVRDLMSVQCKEAELIQILIKYALYKWGGSTLLSKDPSLEIIMFLMENYSTLVPEKWRLLPVSEGLFGEVAEELFFIKLLRSIWFWSLIPVLKGESPSLELKHKENGKC